MAQVNIDVAKEASVQAVNTTVGTVNTSVQAVNTKVGTSNDTASSTPTTVFAGIKGLIGWFTGTWTVARAEMVNTIGQYLDASSGSLQNTIHGKLNTLFDRTFYNSASVAYWAYMASSKSVIKSVQVGNVSTSLSLQDNNFSVFTGYEKPYYMDITISAVNVNKCIVSFMKSANSAADSNGNAAKLMNNTTLRIYGNSEKAIQGVWQIVEFN